jgi:hypothetical protein
MNNKQQLEVCEKFGADFFPASQDLKAGVALNVMDRATTQKGIQLVGIFGQEKSFHKSPIFFILYM